MAPVTDQARVLDCPWVRVAGVAVKLVMEGSWEAATVTVAEAVAEPAGLVAVRV
ncbi:MAG: hypothetical protein U0P81_04790 [Holophagaceae bacterium]